MEGWRGGELAEEVGGGYFHCLFSVRLIVCRPVDGGGEEKGGEGRRGDGGREGAVSCI